MSHHVQSQLKCFGHLTISMPSPIPHSPAQCFYPFRFICLWFFSYFKNGLMGFWVSVVCFTFINPGHFWMSLSCHLIPIVVLAILLLFHNIISNGTVTNITFLYCCMSVKIEMSIIIIIVVTMRVNTDWLIDWGQGAQRVMTRIVGLSWSYTISLKGTRILVRMNSFNSSLIIHYPH